MTLYIPYADHKVGLVGYNVEVPGCAPLPADVTEIALQIYKLAEQSLSQLGDERHT